MKNGRDQVQFQFCTRMGVFSLGVLCISALGLCSVPRLADAHGAANLHNTLNSGSGAVSGQVPERGHATIKVLRHTQTISIEWLVSAWSVLGFEGLPNTQVEQKLWSQTLGLLFNPQALWIFNEKAECYPLEAIVTSPLLMNEAITHQVPSKMHAGPAHESGPSHSHEHTHHHTHQQGAQSEALEGFFRGRYTFRCVKMAELNTLDVMVFAQFPAVQSAKMSLGAGGWAEQAPQHVVLVPTENTLHFE